MSKKRKRKRTKRPGTESRATQTVTVLWMVSLITLALLGVMSVVCLTIDYATDVWNMRPVIGFLLFAGCVVSLVAALSCLVAVRLRERKPPRGLVTITGLLAVAPWLVVWML